jgi:ABC-type phosphate transport system substrate-binding protein
MLPSHRPLRPFSHRFRAAATAAALVAVALSAAPAASADDTSPTTTAPAAAATSPSATAAPVGATRAAALAPAAATPAATATAAAPAAATPAAAAPADGATAAALPQAGGIELKGTGSSFAGIEILQWQVDVSKPPYNLNINYQSSSSGAGRALFTQKSVDFAVSDIQYERSENPPTFPFAYIPVSAGGIAMMYNLKQVPDLRLSSHTICGVFTGAIPFWDDAAIQADNPGKALPHVKVTPVLRGDPAGTNFVMQEYCIAKEPATWNGFVDALNANPCHCYSVSHEATSIWPDFSGSISKNGSDGVAQAVADPNGAGYIAAVETGYATQRNFPVAAVRNHDGAYVKPSEDSVTAALGYATQRDNGTHSLNFDGAGSNVYNPSSYSYLLAPLNIAADKGAVLGLFANYALTLGQQKASSLQYAELGRSLEQFGLDQVKKIPGAPAATPEMLAALTPAGKGVGELAGGGSTVNRAAVGGGNTAGTAGGGTGSNGGTGSAGSGGTATAQGADPSVSLDPPVGGLGKTGGEQGVLAVLGLALLGGGEVVRRRVRRRA